jgi:SAM-dependent methyltransferase
MMQLHLRRALSALLQGDASGGRALPGPTRAGIVALLGLGEDRAYAAARNLQRDHAIERLSGCAPANTAPEALSGYLGEAALRFVRTMEWLDVALRELAPGNRRLLEIGSNPFFLTLLIADRHPEVEHMGVNFFGAPVPAIETQAITDARNRLKESRFLHADVERHDLAPAGADFDVVLFCEVLEHLPYDPAWALHNIARRLRRGGQMIVTTPNPARMENLVRMVELRETFSDPISGYGIHGRHNREYSARELKEMLEGTGLRVLQATTIDVVAEPESRDAETRGYGAYHMVRATLEGEPRLVRPPWLYRSFDAGVLSQPDSLAPPAD